MNQYQEKDHIHFMHVALQEAQKGFDRQEVPVGAVIVDSQGEILGQAYNMVEEHCTQAAHAEVLAISKAGKKLQNWRLLDCTLYVTLEPCAMCMALIRLSRIKHVVFGAHSPLYGYRIVEGNNDIDKKESFTILEGICAEKAGDLMKKFFLKKRDK